MLFMLPKLFILTAEYIIKSRPTCSSFSIDVTPLPSFRPVIPRFLPTIFTLPSDDAELTEMSRVTSSTSPRSVSSFASPGHTDKSPFIFLTLGPFVPLWYETLFPKYIPEIDLMPYGKNADSPTCLRFGISFMLDSSMLSGPPTYSTLPSDVI